jgi:glycosyltransferase involved in cell wall biosynthesis
LYAPLLAPRPFVITIHDLIHLHFPQFFKRKVGPYYQIVVRSVCARADRVLTDDERTIEDLQRFLGVPEEKVRVVPLGCDDLYRMEGEGEPVERPFFLYVGNHLPHKDLPTLLAAWASLPQHHAVDLYITGEDDLPVEWRVERNWGAIHFLGAVTTERLAGLYRSCAALVHPALREGFGLTMLEAAAAGARVIACEDSVPMVLRSYVDRFPAHDVRTLAALMHQALETGAKHPRLREVAQALGWDRCARATAEVYREVLEEHRSQ